MSSIVPALPLVLGAIATAAMWRLRLLWLVLAPMAALAAAIYFEQNVTASFLQFDVVIATANPYSLGFTFAFSVVAMLAGFYGYNSSRIELSAGLLSAAAAVGISYAGDWLTLLVFWEMLMLASLAIIWARQTEASRAAGLRYLYLHLIGGMLLFVGILLHARTGGIALSQLTLDSPSSVLIFLGLIINAAAPPFWSWVSDAYAEASPAGTVFLSAFTTKSAVLVLLLTFPGQELLLWLGLIMVLYGIIYALNCNDIRRTLLYSLVGQLGFMLAIVGIVDPNIHNLADTGVAAHAISHIFYKALLLMTAGVVITATGSNRFTDMGGLYRYMPLTAAFAVLGGLTIAGTPLTMGFVSKSMLIDAAISAKHQWAWLGLSIASAATLLYVGLKYPWFVFFHKVNSSLAEKVKTPWHATLAMVALAVLIIAFGSAPQALYELLPTSQVEPHPYTYDHVLSQVQVLVFATLLFFLLLRYLEPTPSQLLDVDWLFRRPLAQALRGINRAVITSLNAVSWTVDAVGNLLLALLLYPHRRAGFMARMQDGSSLVLAALLTVGGILALFLMR